MGKGLFGEGGCGQTPMGDRTSLGEDSRGLYWDMMVSREGCGRFPIGPCGLREGLACRVVWGTTGFGRRLWTDYYGGLSISGEAIKIDSSAWGGASFISVRGKGGFGRRLWAYSYVKKIPAEDVTGRFSWAG